MAEKTASYVDIDSLPLMHRGATRWPYDEWANIPTGKALEVTELLDGRKPRQSPPYRVALERRGLIAVVRGSRLWVARPKLEAQP